MMASGLLKSAVLPLLLLVLCALQCIESSPSPEFGIKPAVPGTPSLLKQSTKTSATFDLVDNADVPLTNGYTLLSDMKSALQYIGGKLTTNGMALSTALNTLVADKSNDIVGAFTPMYAAVDALRTLMASGFTAQFTALEVQGASITNQFKDAFKAIRDSLTLFTGALDRMKQAVTSARDAPGNPPNGGISTTNMNKYVNSKLAYDVQDALGRLTADVPLLEYIIAESQKKLGLADSFLGDMYKEAQDVISATKNLKDVFTSDAASVGTNIAQPLDERVTPTYSAQLQAFGPVKSAIEALSSYTEDLKPALTSLEQALGTNGIATEKSTLEGKFTTFKTNVDASVAGSAGIEKFFIAETCPGLRAVIGSLVANAPYSYFCFSKYSPKLYNQFAMSSYVVSECYEIETFRLYRLQDLMAVIVDMIVYDVEDLGEAITSCAALTNGAPCLTLVGPYYEILSTTITSKMNYILSFTEDELNFSLQRLSACVVMAKYTTVIAVQALIANQNSCSVTGPVA